MTSNLILGGSGLIGIELQKQLRENGEQVINLDIKEGIDLRDHSLDEYAGVDYVWFLAWDSGGAKYISNEKNFLNIYKNSILLCNTIFSFIKKHNKPFLFTTSQLAASDTPYGLTKLFAEKWGSMLGGKIVRLWNVYGWEAPDERSHVIPDLIIQALSDKKIVLMTSGEERRQFVYVEDCVRNMIRIKKMNGTNFALTNGRWMMIKEVAQIISSQLKVPLQLGKNKGYENMIEPFETVPEQSSFKYSLEDGINEIVKSARNYLQVKA